MTKRGRKSLASLAIRPVTPLGVSALPVPPTELNDEEAHEWREIVASLPADWFARETHALLTQYCRHIVAARRVAQLVVRFEASSPFDLEGYIDALKAQLRESAVIASLATKMRIAQQSTYDKSKKKGDISARKPWEHG